MRKILIIIGTLLVVILLVLGACAPARVPAPAPVARPTPPPTPTPPSAPSNLTADAVSQSQVELHWFDNSDNEEGFRLYRDNNVIATLPANTTAYEDTGLRVATTYKYIVKAYNVAGESGTLLCTVRTPNPPITVRLDRIGVYDNGEHPLRGKAGEVYVGIIVTDLNTTAEKRFPAGEGQFYKLYVNEIIDVGATIFSVDEVGDYLRIAAIGYEDDGGLGETLLYKALGAATEAYITGGSGSLLEMSDFGLGNILAKIFGAEDDWLGSYEKAWGYDDNWGIGIYTDIACEEEDGTLGLRLWFTIESPMESLVSTERPTPASVAPSPPSSTEVVSTIDFLEFPTRGEEYEYATIKIKASKPGAYSLTLFDESATGSASRVYDLGTILTDDYGVGKWHFKVDEDFELDRVRIWYKEGERSFLVVDMVVISR